jgi:hypothetical protein
MNNILRGCIVEKVHLRAAIDQSNHHLLETKSIVGVVNINIVISY